MDYGVTKKHLTLCLDYYITDKTFLDKVTSNFKKFTPTDFNSKAKSTKEQKYWKAHDYRRWGLYEGMIVLEKFLDAHAFAHFLCYVEAYR